MRSRILLAQAVDELAEAVDWYDAQTPGAGRRLNAAVTAVVDRLCEGSTIPVVVPGLPKRSPLRRALVPRYPYSIIVDVTPDTVRVLAIAHAKRRPAYWRDRSD